MIAERGRLAAAVSSHASRVLPALVLCGLACGLGCGVDGESGAGDAEKVLPAADSSSSPPSEADLIETQAWSGNTNSIKSIESYGFGFDREENIWTEKHGRQLTMRYYRITREQWLR